LEDLCLCLGLDSSLEETRFLYERSFELTDIERDRDILLDQRRDMGDFFFEYLSIEHRFDDDL